MKLDGRAREVFVREVLALELFLISSDPRPSGDNGSLRTRDRFAPPLEGPTSRACLGPVVVLVLVLPSSPDSPPDHDSLSSFVPELELMSDPLTLDPSLLLSKSALVPKLGRLLDTCERKPARASWSCVAPECVFGKGAMGSESAAVMRLLEVGRRCMLCRGGWAAEDSLDRSLVGLLSEGGLSVAKDSVLVFGWLTGEFTSRPTGGFTWGVVAVLETPAEDGGAIVR